MKIRRIQQILSAFKQRQVKQVEIAKALGITREFVSQLSRAGQGTAA